MERTGYEVKARAGSAQLSWPADWAMQGRKFDGFYLGEEKDGRLVYAGKVRACLNRDVKQSLIERLKPLHIAQPALRIIASQTCADGRSRNSPLSLGVLLVRANIRSSTAL